MPEKASMNSNRREFLRSAGCLLYSVAGADLWLTPAEARARGAAFRVLDPQQVRTLEAFGDLLAPGAREAGVAHFVDSQLTVHPNDSLLIARSFNIEPPYQGFYAGALAAVERFSEQRHRRPFDALAESEAVALVREIAAKDPDGWAGPPAPLAYVVLRSDAVDVVYGTVEGFRRLNVPYMPHILPPTPW
jgi:hypothetical protein